MLGREAQSSFSELILDYPLTIAIPPNVQLELRQRGPMPTRDGDVRVAPRFRCKGPAIMQWISSPSGLPIQHPTTQVIVRNLSRTGFSVLVDRQWFPEQVASIQFPVAIATAKVVRARRLGGRCFDIGFRILTYRSLEPTDASVK